MIRSTQPTSRVRRLQRIGTNYLGGLGYYALLFGWALMLLLFLLRISQFVMQDGYVIEVLPDVATNHSTVSPEASVSWGLLLTIPLIAALFAVVVAVPYILGRYASRLSRRCIRLLLLAHTKTSLLKVKIGGAVLLFILTTIGVFGFYQEVGANIASYLIYACAVVAVVFFALQHVLSWMCNFSFDETF
ncbi:MAG: hypothetical protein ACTJG2_01195 [Candidatus Saccharimonadales bacterium]